MTDAHAAVLPATSLLPTTEDESIALVDELCLRYRNWGRWGAEDQRGTLNFITPQALTHAALVQAALALRDADAG